jgi:DNA-binding IclR family transcriptional regulator
MNTTKTRSKRQADPAALVDANSDQYQSKAINRALDVLEYFRDDLSRFNLKDLSDRMNMPMSSLFRVLATLESRSYVMQLADGSYCLTPRVLHGKLRERADRLTELALPFLHLLAGRFNETASLAYLFENRIQVLDSVNAFHEVRVINTPGRVLPPHCSSLGKAITAFQPQPLMDQILEVHGLYPRTAHSLRDRGAILTEFKKVRETGYAEDREEASEGGICFGVPIHSIDGRVRAAVSISSVASRMTPQRERDIIQELRKTTSELTAALEEANGK